MPTADEFRRAARRLQEGADDCGSVGSRIRALSNNHGVSGGRLQILVEDALVANMLGAAAIAEQCEALAELCSERALVCEQYAGDLVRWERSVETWSDRHAAMTANPRSGIRVSDFPPRRPDPPAAWVEVG